MLIKFAFGEIHFRMLSHESEIKKNMNEREKNEFLNYLRIVTSKINKLILNNIISNPKHKC